jgi:hypothetical protein
MPHPSTAEKVELAAIPVVTVLAGGLAPRPNLRLELGVLIAGAALVLLLQGFVRDLWLLRQARRHAATNASHAARCLCVESAIGLTGIAAGIGLTGFGLAWTVLVTPAALAGGVGATLFAGYLLKDFVFEWSPWKIRREKDHAQVIFRWRR